MRLKSRRNCQQHYHKYTLLTKFVVEIRMNSFCVNMLSTPCQYLKTVSCTMNLNQFWFGNFLHFRKQCGCQPYPSVHTTVIDALAIVHMVKPKNNCTVDEYCKIYMKYVGSFFNKTFVLFFIATYH